MNGIFKIIGAIAGYYFLRGIGGAFLGFFVGSAIDNYLALRSKVAGENAGGQSNRPNSNFDPFQYYQQNTQNTDFASMLMVLSAGVMKADGKIVKAELEYVKAFFTQQFGSQFGTHHLQTLKKYLDSSSLPVQQICSDIAQRTTVEIRIHLLHYLFGIAKADGDVSVAEVNEIQRIANYLRIPPTDFETIKSMFYRSADGDYLILGITASASDEEIKKAYRAMALRYHPDKVLQMGPEYQEGAKEKFQKVQEAYENLKKKRGIK
jgi:DnaJ like chaperone protein